MLPPLKLKFKKKCFSIGSLSFYLTCQVNHIIFSHFEQRQTDKSTSERIKSRDNKD